MTSTLAEKTNTAEVQDDFAQYLKEIRSYPLLTAEEERKIAEGCAKGDKNAIRTMVNSNLRLVVSIARKYTGRGVAIMDLIQEGSIGLVNAAKKVDPTQNTRFSTYASHWIRQGISRCILNNAGIIHLPRQKMEQIKKLMAVSAAMEQEGLEPETEELSARTGIAPEKVEELMDMVPVISSLDAPAGSPEHDALQELLEDITAPQPQEELVRTELKHTLDTLLAKLDQRQQQILRLHFGLEDGNEHSLAEIGEIIGVSKERARQIEQQAFAKLRVLGADLGLEDFLDD